MLMYCRHIVIVSPTRDVTSFMDDPQSHSADVKTFFIIQVNITTERKIAQLHVNLVLFQKIIYFYQPI